MSRQVYFMVVTPEFQNDAGFDMGVVNADPNDTIAALKEKVAAEIGVPKMKFKIYADKSTALALNAAVDKHGSDPANALMVQLVENRSAGTAHPLNLETDCNRMHVIIHFQGLRISIPQNMHCSKHLEFRFAMLQHQLLKLQDVRHALKHNAWLLEARILHITRSVHTFLVWYNYHVYLRPLVVSVCTWYHIIYFRAKV